MWPFRRKNPAPPPSLYAPAVEPLAPEPLSWSRPPASPEKPKPKPKPRVPLPAKAKSIVKKKPKKKPKPTK